MILAPVAGIRFSDRGSRSGDMQEAWEFPSKIDGDRRMGSPDE